MSNEILAHQMDLRLNILKAGSVQAFYQVISSVMPVVGFMVSFGERIDHMLELR